MASEDALAKVVLQLVVRETNVPAGHVPQAAEYTLENLSLQEQLHDRSLPVRQKRKWVSDVKHAVKKGAAQLAGVALLQLLTVRKDWQAVAALDQVELIEAPSLRL